MAEENTINQTEPTTTEPTTEPKNDTPTVEELMAQLAVERAEKERYKTANDKLSKEAADSKRQLRAKQSAEDQEAEAKAEAERLRDEETENMRKELNHIKAVAAYKEVSEKLVENLIEAVAENNHDAIAAIMKSDRETAVATAVASEKAKWMGSRPRVNTGGTYSGMTKDQIMAIADRTERRKAIAENSDLFN